MGSGNKGVMVLVTLISLSIHMLQIKVIGKAKIQNKDFSIRNKPLLFRKSVATTACLRTPCNKLLIFFLKKVCS